LTIIEVDRNSNRIEQEGLSILEESSSSAVLSSIARLGSGDSSRGCSFGGKQIVEFAPAQTEKLQKV
jgi:hypothetical protein